MHVAFAGALAVLAFPADGSALAAASIWLTPTGPFPAVLSIPAGMYPVWRNNDTVTHTVVFANGKCSLQIVPGGYAECSDFSSLAGDYPYTVDGTVQASIVVSPEGRAVTLRARSHRIRAGSDLRLHGQLVPEHPSPPGPGPEQPVIVLARHDRMHPFHRIAVVVARIDRSNGHGLGELLWQLRVRPRTRTTYIAEANSQPPGGQYWQRAWSEPVTVLVHR